MKFFVRTKNSKGNVVRAQNKGTKATVTLEVVPDRNAEECFESRVKVSLSRNNKGELTLLVFCLTGDDLKIQTNAKSIEHEPGEVIDPPYEPYEELTRQ